MNHVRCLKIADRIHAWLLHELGQGIDRQRMLQDPVYARDVLLVCDAHPGTAMAALAQHFRQSVREDAQPDPPGFSASRFLSSLFGPSSKPGLSGPSSKPGLLGPRSKPGLEGHPVKRAPASAARVEPDLG